MMAGVIGGALVNYVLRTCPNHPEPDTIQDVSTTQRFLGETLIMARSSKIDRPPFDFAAVAADEAPPIRHTRASALEGTPFPGWVERSYATGPLKITVPGIQAGKAVSMLRQAATQAGYGISFGHSGADIESWPSRKSVEIVFHAKVKTPRPRKPKAE